MALYRQPSASAYNPNQMQGVAAGGQVQTISEKDLGGGIDAKSAESQIPAGKVEDLVNGSTNAQGTVRKRNGYQGFAGALPLRVAAQGVNTVGGVCETQLQFAPSLNLSELTRASDGYTHTPIILAGKSGNMPGGSVFTPTVVASSYVPKFRVMDDQYLIGTSANTVDLALTAPVAHVDIFLKQSTTRDNVTLSPTQSTITLGATAPYLTTIAGLPITANYVVCGKSKVAEPGTVYIATISAAQTIIGTFQHGLTSPYMIARVYSAAGVQMFPTVTISDVGVVQIAAEGATPRTLVLTAIPLSRVVKFSGTSTSLSARTSPYTTLALYTQVGNYIVSAATAATGTYTESTNTLAVTCGAGSHVLLWEDTAPLSNTIAFTSVGLTTAALSSSVQLAVWGIPHPINAATRLGYVNHLDAYVTDADRRMICGLGGTLYAARTQAEIGTTYRLPTVYPRLAGTAASAQSIGPGIWDTGETPARTAGYITADNGGNHWLEIVAARWISGTTHVEYTLNAPNFTCSTNLAAVLNGIQPVTITGMGHAVNSGEFTVVAASGSGSTITVTCNVPARINADYDEVDCGGQFGIFADALTLVSTPEFVAGDWAVIDDIQYEVLSVAGNTLYLGDLLDTVAIASGAFLSGRRTSSTFIVQSAARDFPATDFPQLVVGDQLEHSSLDRYLTITAVDPLTFAVTVDEVITITDTADMSETLTVPQRWIPIEIPYGISSEPRALAARAYDDQSFLRSTCVAASMFLTDGENVTRKFDGYSNYRAGLIRWQPGLFITKDEKTAAISVPAQPTATITNASAGTEAITDIAGVGAFAMGDKVIYDHDGKTYTIIRIVSDTATAHYSFIIDAVPATWAAGTFTKNATATYSYYFRLNAVDVNGFTVASAATGLGDYVVELAKSSTINLRLLGFPAGFDAYDYTRLEVEVYRTLQNGSPPYYKIITKPIVPGVHQYIDITDSASDDAILGGEDRVHSALKQQEVGTAWTEPPRAAHITSMGNRLILGNITDYPELNLRFGIATNNAALSGDILSIFNGPANSASFKFITSGAAAVHVETVAAATVTIHQPNGTLPAVGAIVYLFRGAAATANEGPYLSHTGWYPVISVDSNAHTYVVNNPTNSTLAATVDIDSCVFGAVNVTPVWLGVDFSIQTAAMALTGSERLNALRRLAGAVNAHQATIAGSSAAATAVFGVPFMYASAGASFSPDQIIIRSGNSTPLTCTLIAGDDYTFFCNEVLVPYASTRTCALAVPDKYNLLGRRFNSRLIASYPNFPEIFDAPTAALDKLSDSVIDVNPADGQEITGIIPFFGISAFGAAMTDAPLLVFKTHGVYVVDIASKQIKKLETRGLGCTYPRSIGATRMGIIFANASGIYRIERDLSMSYVGFYMERKWQNETELELSDMVHGHHFATGSEYKLSVPLLGDATPADVYVYDHTREDDSQAGPGQGDGAWSRHDAIPSLGWANLEADEFYARPDGRVFVRRRSGTAADYRDGADPIAFSCTLRAMDFGNPGIRKNIRRISSHFRAIMDSIGTTMSAAINLSKNFLTLDTFVIDGSDTPVVASNADEVQRQQAAATQFALISSTLEALSITAPEVIPTYEAMIAQANIGATLALKADPTGLVDLPPALDDLSGMSGDKMVSITSTLPSKKVQYLQLKYENSTLDEGIELAGVDFRVTGLTHSGMTEARDTRTK